MKTIIIITNQAIFIEILSKPLHFGIFQIIIESNEIIPIYTKIKLIILFYTFIKHPSQIQWNILYPH